MVASQQQQQKTIPAAHLESSLGSQRRSSITFTEHAALDRTKVVADGPQHYPMDDIIARTPCELLYQQRKKIKLVTHGIAEVPIQGGTIHGMQIPDGYARVMVD